MTRKHARVESGAVESDESRDVLEPVTAAQATLVRGGVRPSPDGRSSLPERKIILLEPAPPPRIVPETWWLDVRRTRPFDD